jgi:hypothetical protein
MSIIRIINNTTILTGLIVATSAMGATLSDVRQNPEQRFVDELVGRIGCEEAARWLAMPKSGAGAFQRTLTTMKSDAMTRAGREDRAKAWYSLTKTSLMDTAGIADACNRQTPKKNPGDGLSELAALAPEGVTIFALGGFGSHTSSEGTLTTSLRNWKTSQKELFNRDQVRFARIECSFSYAPDETVCGEDMLRQIKEFDAASASPGKHKFILWGYSKGGISALEILRRDGVVRSRTLAVVSVGAPLRGSVIMDRLSPALDSYAGHGVITGSSDTLGADAIMKILTLWVGGSRAGAGAIMADFPLFRDGARSLTSSERERFLSTQLAPGAMARPDGTKIPVFQLAGLIDPRVLASMPVMTVRDGKLVPRSNTVDPLQTAQLAALIASLEHPLGDSCVALEDALLPVERAQAAGLDPRFLGLARMDHLGLRFHRQVGEMNHGIPDHAFVDAALSAVVAGLKVGAHP